MLITSFFLCPIIGATRAKTDIPFQPLFFNTKEESIAHSNQKCLRGEFSERGEGGEVEAFVESVSRFIFKSNQSCLPFNRHLESTVSLWGLDRKVLISELAKRKTRKCCNGLAKKRKER